MRIVSLIASATEIICALDAGEWLVGRSHECDAPAWVRSLPAFSQPAFDITISSAQIDREVRRRLARNEPLYHVDTEGLRALRPDLVIAQSHCEVCAVTPGDVKRNGGLPAETRVLPLSAGTLDEVFASVGSIAQELGMEERGAALIAKERDRLERLRARVSGLPKPSLVVLEWTDPVFPMGNWGPELVDIAGGVPGVGNRGTHSQAIPTEHISEADPDYIIVAPCGFNLERSARELPVLQQQSWWREMRAVREGRIAFADGNLYFNRSGMTVVRTAEILAEILHGVISGEPSEGLGWRWMRDLPRSGEQAA